MTLVKRLVLERCSAGEPGRGLCVQVPVRNEVVFQIGFPNAVPTLVVLVLCHVNSCRMLVAH